MVSIVNCCSWLNLDWESLHGGSSPAYTTLHNWVDVFPSTVHGYTYVFFTHIYASAPLVFGAPFFFPKDASGCAMCYSTFLYFVSRPHSLHYADVLFFFPLKLAVLILESVVTSDTAELCAIRAELCAQKRPISPLKSSTAAGPPPAGLAGLLYILWKIAKQVIYKTTLRSIYCKMLN